MKRLVGSPVETHKSKQTEDPLRTLDNPYEKVICNSSLQSLAGGRHLLTTVVYRSNAFNRAIVCTFKEHIQDNINLIRGGRRREE